MRILVIAHAFPPQSQGGAEIYAEEHTRALVRLFRDDVHVVAREQRPELQECAVRTERRDGFTITWINNTFRDASSFEDSYRSPRIARIAAGVIDAFAPDAAHIHHLTCLSTGIPALLAARHIPVVLTLHDYWLQCHRGQLLDMNYRLCDGPGSAGCGACVGVAAANTPSLLSPAAGALDRRFERQRVEHMRRVCAQVTYFLAPAPDIRDRFIRFGVPAERIELSPYGFERAPFRRVQRTRRADEPLRLGFLGTLMVSKAPHLLLEAFTQLPAGSVTVDLFGAQSDYHGDASYREVLAPLLDQPGVRVHGPQPHDRVPDALASIDALVVPSIWPDTSPLVIREALMSGVPVVGSAIGGIPDAVQHERNGLLFEAGNIEALRHALARLVDEPGLLERLSAGALATEIRSIEDDVAAFRERVTPHESTRVRGSDPRVAAIVLNYRTPDDTAIAVGALLASDRPPDEVIVVDNDEAPGCREAVARWGDAVTYLATGRNLGFAGGMNAGIRVALDRGADLLLLVNSDVVVPPDCLATLEATISAEPGIGVVGPRILSRARPDVIGSDGVDYNRRTGRMRHRAVGAAAHDVDAAREVDAVSGCLMLVTREAFERAGLLDERYFFSFEEIDFCLRARAAGLGTRLVPDAVAFHEGSRAIGAGSSRRFYFAARNHLMLAQTHANGDGAATRAARAAFIAGLNLAHAVAAPGGSLRTRVAATVRGIGDHIAGRYGIDPAGRGAR